MDGAAGDASVGSIDSSFAADVSARDTATGSDETGPGRGPDSAAGQDASTEDAPSDETSTQDAGAEASPGDSGISTDTGVLADTGAFLPDSGAEPDTGAPNDSGATDARPADSGSTCPGHGITGAIVTFDLSGQPGDEASAAATSSAAGVTGGSITRSTGLTPITGSSAINSSGWSEGSSADKSLYYAFTLTPAAGCTVTLTSLSIDVKASATGPSHADVGTSADGYTTLSTAFAGTSVDTVPLSATATAPITVHVFGYGATSTQGTLRIENTMTVSGTIE